MEKKSVAEISAAPRVAMADIAAVAPLAVTRSNGAGGVASDTDVDMDIDDEVRNAETTIDVCILMDCTGSMERYIEAAKRTSVRTAQEIKTELPKARYRLGRCLRNRFFVNVTILYTAAIASPAALHPVYVQHLLDIVTMETRSS